MEDNCLKRIRTFCCLSAFGEVKEKEKLTITERLQIQGTGRISVTNDKTDDLFAITYVALR